jgi:DNA ligase (NAD+)
MASTTKSTTKTITKQQIKRLELNPHEEGLDLDIDLLEKIITKSKNDYFNNSETPLLTDNTFDILEIILKEKKPNSNVFKLVGAVIANPEDKVKLPYYMSSLDKVKPGEKVLTKWLKNNPADIIVSEKVDGLSGLLIIEKGADNKYTMTLYKHGDGVEGQNISQLIEKGINITISGKLNHKEIDKVLQTEKHLAVRGEIIIKKSVFANKYNKLYQKDRALVAGIVNSKHPDANIIKDMEIVFYELITPCNMTFEEQFKSMKSYGLNVVNYKTYKSLVESQLPEILMTFKQESLYEIDGIILTDNTKSHKRILSGNPKYSVAFKMPLDEQIANTKILNVEYNISKHGTLAPRIQYYPVVIKGDTHQYTSGFNLKYIVDNKINIGTEIQIIKSGDVIPYIYKILKTSEEPLMPPKEIKWHWNDTHVDAIVDNAESNEDVRTKRIISFFAVMKIAGVGEGVVNKLVNAGYDEIKNILELTPDVIAQIDGFQLKSATNVYNSIHKVIDVPQPLDRVMTASNIFGIGLGEKKFKLVLDAIPNFIEKWVMRKSLLRPDIMSVEGFSDKSVDLLLEGMPKFIEWLDIHKNIITLEKPSEKQKPKGDKFAGMVVVFTGVRNADMEKAIVDGGGVIGSGVSGKTTLIIAKDPSESSSKLNKARETGIPIMGIDAFAKQYSL